MHDSVIADKLHNGPRNATYTSPNIQNSLLNVLGNAIRKKICSEVREAGAYSILCNETKDCSKQEQLSLMVRYVDNKAVIHEHFLTYMEVKDLDAKSLTGYIVSALETYCLDPKLIVSQGYDGASVMSGSCTGVQTRLKEVAPHATYIHCYAHSLNLVLVDCAKAIPHAAEFFCLMESLYVFIAATKAHAIFMSKQHDLHPTKQPLQLQKLSDTRWSCRYRAVNALCRTYDSLLATLHDISESNDHSKAVEARGFLHHVEKFSFIVSLITFDRILSCTKSLSDQLQSVQIDLSSAANLVQATKSVIEEYRTDEFWDKVYHYAKDVAELHSIEVESVCQSRRKKHSTRLSECVILESTEHREPLSASDIYKTSLYYPVLDVFLAELSQRFDQKNLDLMRAIQACHPQSENFLNLSTLQPLIDTYDLQVDALTVETTLAKQTLQGKDLNCINDVFLALTSLDCAFPVLIKLLRIALTIAVNTAQCERAFSTLKRVKSYLRPTMNEQRLSDLAILSIERELSSNVSLDYVVTEFSGVDGNRRILLY